MWRSICRCQSRPSARSWPCKLPESREISAKIDCKRAWIAQCRQRTSLQTQRPNLEEAYVEGVEEPDPRVFCFSYRTSSWLWPGKQNRARRGEQSHGRGPVATIFRQRRLLRARPELRPRRAMAALRLEELHPHDRLRDAGVAR